MTDTQITDDDLKGLRDSRGRQLKARQLYFFGNGTRKWMIDHVHPSGYVDLRPAEVLTNSRSRRRNRVKPALLTPARRHRQPTEPPAANTQLAEAQINSSMTELASLPRLEGAACVGLTHIFDRGPSSKNYLPAASICRICPALEACRNWAATVPKGKLSGFIAGRIYAPKTYK